MPVSDESLTSLRCLQVTALDNNSRNAIKSFFTNSLGHNYDIASDRGIKDKRVSKQRLMEVYGAFLCAVTSVFLSISV